ncbi:copper amine oxidase N-terminal domain-containing protein [Paenibacillus alkaliterrae]|uniref:copper amine oxidase N-terminal domain-containing protein n=1 Tax=Paenibacillus alkaliterrae TaxID=320909 RepID=UPI001F2962CD|nr:copper amine oxidase N-terminal domain-containing protein [Paenibacillus alkaliterrae]MCF2939778.1 copper amine oxidase N-terminal domain-containing protein [Paenibacillus alkaliterrae]
MKNRCLTVIMLLISLLLSIAPLSASAAGSAAVTAAIQTKTQPISLVFDGQELKLPDKQYSFIYQGRTYVPIRYISYALQKMVAWDGEKATISEPTEKELASLKKHLQSAAAGTQKPQASVTISMKSVKAKLVFDGKEKVLPAGQILFNYNGSIYVPLRFLAESAGTDIGWDPATKTVSGESAAFRAEQGAGEEEASLEPEEGSEGSEGTGTEAGAGAGAGGGTGAGGGAAGTVKLTYEQITADAEARLGALRNSCETTLFGILLENSGADNELLKSKLLQEVDNCTAKFEAIMTDVTAQLATNGYSTAVIADYRAAYQAQLDAGRNIVGSMG